MHRYRLTFLLFFVPFMLTSGLDRLQESGWSLVRGVFEIALGVAIVLGAANEIRNNRRRQRAGEQPSPAGGGRTDSAE